MSEFDPRNTDSTEENTTAGPRAGEEGTAYTTPDGSHGCIYNSESIPEAPRGQARRGGVIAAAVLVMTLVFGACCFGGAWMAVRTLGSRYESGSGTEGGELGTSGGLYIDNETRKGDALSTGDPSDTLGREPGDPGAQSPIHTGEETAPGAASIEKLPAKRPDTNGDGRSELETDERGEVITSAGRNPLSVATVVARVAASVVEIRTETVVQSGYLGQYVTSGAGSGVVVSREGFIVTNHHVIAGASSMTVRMSDGREFAATLVGTDELTDIAVLWIDAGDYPLTVATLGASADLVVGEDIIAIGNPLGSLGGTVTEGMISATARDISVGGSAMTLLQVSAPINPGNSGGGLFNLAGELIGVVNAKVSSEEIEGLGFAIPVDTAYGIILELIDHGYVRGRPALGCGLTQVSDWSSTYVQVTDGGCEGLTKGDLILAADGTRIQSIEELNAVIRRHRVGDTLELTVYRSRSQRSVTVTITEYTPTGA